MTIPISHPDREEQLNEILLSFLDALESGQGPDRNQFLAAHPEFAADLAEFLACRDQLERLTAPLRDNNRSSPSPGIPAGFRASLPPPQEEGVASGTSAEL